MQNKYFKLLLILLIIAFIIPQITLAAWWNPFSWGIWNKIFHKQTSVVCTKEAKICPDGSTVGRVGPKCEFVPCPVPKGVLIDSLKNVALVYPNPYDISKNDTIDLVNGKSDIIYDAGNIKPRAYNVAATAVGDLDGDGVPEGAIGVYQGWGANRITPIVFVFSNKNGVLTQIDSAVPDMSNWQDETQIKSLSIDNGIFTVNILILSEADKQLPHYQQQASVPKTVQYKLINGKLVLQQPNETASWKTYTNTQYGFEIKYPKDWQIGYQSNSFAHFYKGTLHGTIGEGAELNIFFNIDNLTLENLIKYTQRPDDQREDFNINGIKAVKLIGKIYQPTEVPIPIEKSLEEKLLVVKDNVKFEIIIDALGQDYQNYLETFNQIISTFKFTK